VSVWHFLSQAGTETPCIWTNQDPAITEYILTHIR